MQLRKLMRRRRCRPSSVLVAGTAALVVLAVHLQVLVAVLVVRLPGPAVPLLAVLVVMVPEGLVLRLRR